MQRMMSCIFTRLVRVAATILVLTTILSPAGPVAGGEPGKSKGRVHTSIERMSFERLASAHRDVKGYRSRRGTLPPFAGLRDYRAILHAHAEDARHTGGTLAEMLAAARKVGVDVILLSDHYRPPRDFMDGWRGLRDGVLFIPGSETRGFLIHPDESVMNSMEAAAEELVEAVGRGTGMVFLSHVEERPDHPMDGLLGMEIYNRHADAKDDRQVLRALASWATDPVEAARIQEALRLYPEELLAAQLDYPEDYLRKWDRESQERRLVGVAANDSHHNQVFLVKMVDERTVRLGTVVDDDEDMRLLSADERPGILEMTRGREPGEVLLRLDFDPYELAFGTVSTHVLAPHLNEASVRQALRSGHAYVSHDWMCDPTGFRFYAGAREADGERSLREGDDSSFPGSPPTAIMGDELPYHRDLLLVAHIPVEGSLHLLRNGKVVIERQGSRLRYMPDGPGVYRVEAWLRVDGEDRVWIYSNPIYLR